MVPPKVSEKLQHSVMKLDRSNKFEFCYYGQVNTFEGNVYFAGDGSLTRFASKDYEIFIFKIRFLCMVKEIITK